MRLVRIFRFNDFVIYVDLWVVAILASALALLWLVRAKSQSR